MKPTRPLILLSACLLLIGCGKGSETNRVSIKGNVEATESPPNTNSKSEDAAKGFFNTWGKNDREAAKKFASGAAITELFKRKSDLKGVSFQGCVYHPGEISSGVFICTYTHEDGTLTMYVKRSEADDYKVESIDFVPPSISIKARG